MTDTEGKLGPKPPNRFVGEASDFEVVRTEDVPKGAVKVHFDSWRQALQGRGEMRKESLSRAIYERLESTWDSWTDESYGDNPNPADLLAVMMTNINSEVALAYQSLLKHINGEEVEAAR